jgi:hypothetical protein
MYQYRCKYYFICINMPCSLPPVKEGLNKPLLVIPAALDGRGAGQAGIQWLHGVEALDPGFRRDDDLFGLSGSPFTQARQRIRADPQQKGHR